MIQLCLSYSSDRAKLQTPSPPHTDGLGALANWHSGRHKVSFLTDTGAAFSLLTSFKGPLQPSEVAIKGVSGIPFYPQITLPLLCSLGKTTLTHSFIVVSQCPTALMGRDLLAKLQTSINLPFLDPISVLHPKFASKWYPNPWPALTPKTCPLIFP